MRLLLEIVRTIRTPLIVDVDSLDSLDESFQVAEEELGDPTHDDIEINVIRQLDE